MATTDSAVDTGVLNEVAAKAGSMPETPDMLVNAELPAVPALVGNAGTFVASKGYFKSYYEDPPQIDVTSVTNTTDWYWNNNGRECVYNVSGGRGYDWYATSGWEKLNDNWANTYVCKESTSSSYAHYRNGRFCMTIDTHNYYNRNTIHGRQDGYLIGEAKASKKGGCTGLLSFHATLKRTQN